MPQLNFGEVYGVIASALGGFGILTLGFVYVAIERDVREAAKVGVVRMEGRHVALPGIVTAYCLFMPLVTTLYAAEADEAARLLTIFVADIGGLSCAVALFKARNILFVPRMGTWMVLALATVFTAVAIYPFLKRPAPWEFLSLCIIIFAMAGSAAVCRASIEKSALLPVRLNRLHIGRMKREFMAQASEHGQLCRSHGLDSERSPIVAELSAKAFSIRKGPLSKKNRRKKTNRALPLEQLKQWMSDLEDCKEMMAAHTAKLKLVTAAAATPRGSENRDHQSAGSTAATGLGGAGERTDR